MASLLLGCSELVRIWTMPMPGPQTRALPRVAFGPAKPHWCSWHWVGADVVGELAKYLPTTSFAFPQVPEADVVCIVKQLPPLAFLDALSRRAAVIYCPIDFF